MPDAGSVASLQRVVQFRSGRCSAVSLPGRGALAPLSAAGSRLQEAAAPRRAVVGRGKLHTRPEESPVAATQAG